MGGLLSCNSNKTQLGHLKRKERGKEREGDRLEMEGKTSQEEEGIRGNGREIGNGNGGRGRGTQNILYTGMKKRLADLTE